MAKPVTAFPEIVYITFISNCSLNRLNLCLLFFADFHMGARVAESEVFGWSRSWNRSQIPNNTRS